MKICRICFEEDSLKNLIAPCRCKGSMREVHPFCMEQWIRIKNIKECEVCHTKLNIKSKYPGILVILYRFLKSLWADKPKILKIALLAIYGQFLYKRICSLKIDFAILAKSSKRSWIKMFGLGALFGIYYAQLVFVFLKESIEMLVALAKMIKGTANISIENYENNNFYGLN